MATTGVQNTEHKRPSLSFHDAYIEVIYGLLAVMLLVILRGLL